jgi:hypothetical protein
MKYRFAFFALSAALWALPSEEVIEAQTMTPPPRVTARAPQPQTRTTHALDMNSTFFGGYDRNLTNALQAPGVQFEKENYTGQGSAGLSYSMGKGARNLLLGGNGNVMTRTSVTRAQRAVYGFNANGSYTQPLSSKAGLFLSQNASRNPFYSQGLFGSLPPGVNYLPDSNPVNGIFDGYLWMMSSSAGMNTTWTSKTTTGLTYYYQRSLHEGGTRQDTRYAVHSGTLSLTQQITQSTGLRFGYQIASRSGDQTGLQYDDVTHGFTVGVSTSHAVSQSRTLSVSVNGGANQINTQSRHYWQPTYYGSVGIDIGRSWVATTTYYQTSYFLSSPLSAPDSYLSQSLTVSTGGNLSRNVGLVFNVGATRGEVAAQNSVTGTSGDYIGFVTGAQISFGLGGGWSATTSANYYQSELRGAAKQFLPTTGAYQRAALWAGLSWNALLYESPRGTRERRGR